MLPKEHEIIHDELVIIQRHKQRVVLNKPIFISAAILDLAKHSMYMFHYFTMPRIFDSYQLCYTDTGENYLLLILSAIIFFYHKHD